MKTFSRLFIGLLIFGSLFFSSANFEREVFAQACAPGLESQVPLSCAEQDGRCNVSTWEYHACFIYNGTCTTINRNISCDWIWTNNNWTCTLKETPGSGYESCCPCGVNRATTCLSPLECDMRGGTKGNACDPYTVSCSYEASCVACPVVGPVKPGIPTNTPTSRPDNTPTPVPVAQCQNILAYNSNWLLLTNTQLTQTRAGNQLYYCVTGYTNIGTFDMARFTINGVLNPNTTLLRPGTTTDYCQAYTVPSSTYNFTISGQIHHVSLGWVQ